MSMRIHSEGPVRVSEVSPMRPQNCVHLRSISKVTLGHDSWKWNLPHNCRDDMSVDPNSGITALAGVYVIGFDPSSRVSAGTLSDLDAFWTEANRVAKATGNAQSLSDEWRRLPHRGRLFVVQDVEQEIRWVQQARQSTGRREGRFYARFIDLIEIMRSSPGIVGIDYMNRFESCFAACALYVDMSVTAYLARVHTAHGESPVPPPLPGDTRRGWTIHAVQAGDDPTGGTFGKDEHDPKPLEIDAPEQFSTFEINNRILRSAADARTSPPTRTKVGITALAGVDVTRWSLARIASVSHCPCIRRRW